MARIQALGLFPTSTSVWAMREYNWQLLVKRFVWTNCRTITNCQYMSISNLSIFYAANKLGFEIWINGYFMMLYVAMLQNENCCTMADKSMLWHHYLCIRTAPRGVEPPLLFVVSDSAIRVSWVEPLRPNGRVTSYRIYLDGERIAAVDSAQPGSHVVDGLEPYTIYEFMVCMASS